MILADKIITLRKKNGWSQEELAEKMNVSRQAVSKWEGAQSVPDLSKVLLLSQIFGVSTDYLLKDDIEEAEPQEQEEPIFSEEKTVLRKVPMEEASEFLEVTAKTAGRIALGVLLCVWSPICVLLLGTAQEEGLISISENAAGGMGIIVLFFMIAAAVALFISAGMQTSAFEYLNKEIIETAYGVDGMVREKQRQYKDTYTKYNVIGTCLCILSVMPLFAALVFTENDFVMVLMICLLLIMIGIATLFFVTAGIRWDSMKKLLQEGDYTIAKKKTSGQRGAIYTVYWLLVTAIFLVYVNVSGEWENAGIIWPVAGILFAVVVTICNVIWKNE